MLPFCIKPKIGQNAEKLSFRYKILVFEKLFLTTSVFLFSLARALCLNYRHLFSQLIPDE